MPEQGQQERSDNQRIFFLSPHHVVKPCLSEFFVQLVFVDLHCSLSFGSVDTTFLTNESGAGLIFKGRGDTTMADSRPRLQDGEIKEVVRLMCFLECGPKGNLYVESKRTAESVTTSICSGRSFADFGTKSPSFRTEQKRCPLSRPFPYLALFVQAPRMPPIRQSPTRG
jgi:hypothetical protein